MYFPERKIKLTDEELNKWRRTPRTGVKAFYDTAAWLETTPTEKGRSMFLRLVSARLWRLPYWSARPFDALPAFLVEKN